VNKETTVTSESGDATRRTQVLSLLPWLWLGLSATWAVVIFVTDQPAWPLALWIATTVGPLTALRTHLDRTPTHQRSNP
jgi:hypothetical protein